MKLVNKIFGVISFCNIAVRQNFERKNVHLYLVACICKYKHKHRRYACACVRVLTQNDKY